ncbi:unknown [Bacteroides stercoris CAG:120]|nr:unknown [Bacteroides stercoris CAG:120]
MGVPISTLSPPFLYTSRIRVLMGELIISSKAGTTLPEALTLTSIVPVLTWENTMSFSFTPVRINEMSTLITTIPAAPMPP